MTPGRQIVAVKFRSGDKRPYTYQWDGDPLACGEVVRVPDRSGDGWQRATVHEIGAAPPMDHRGRLIPLKAVLGRLEGPGLPPSDQRTALDDGDDSDLFGGVH